MIIMLVKYVSIDGIPQVFLSFRIVDIIVITVHDRFWNVGQANCILKYFENMMIDHCSEFGNFVITFNYQILLFFRKWLIFLGKYILLKQELSISHKMADYLAFPLLLV